MTHYLMIPQKVKVMIRTPKVPRQVRVLQNGSTKLSMAFAFRGQVTSLQPWPSLRFLSGKRGYDLCYISFAF